MFNRKNKQGVTSQASRGQLPNRFGGAKAIISAQAKVEKITLRPTNACHSSISSVLLLNTPAKLRYAVGSGEKRSSIRGLTTTTIRIGSLKPLSDAITFDGASFLPDSLFLPGDNFSQKIGIKIT
jgi:hypothetical protein